MKNFAITMSTECGPFISVTADSYKLRYSFKGKPDNVVFYKGKDVVCMIDYHYIYEIAEIKDNNYIKLDF